VSTRGRPSLKRRLGTITRLFQSFPGGWIEQSIQPLTSIGVKKEHAALLPTAFAEVSEYTCKPFHLFDIAKRQPVILEHRRKRPSNIDPLVRLRLI
jgi:hypothetical protein